MQKAKALTVSHKPISPTLTGGVFIHLSLQKTMIARTLTQHLSRKGFDIHDKQVAAIIEECDFYITQKYIFECQEEPLSQEALDSLKEFK